MPDDDFERELGPTVTGAFQHKAVGASEARAGKLVSTARRRIRRRRQGLLVASAAVVVAAAIGGVWQMVGAPVPTAGKSSSESAAGGSSQDRAAPELASSGCPPQHPIAADGMPPGTGLELAAPVKSLVVCRYQLSGTGTTLLGSMTYDATRAQEVVNAIKPLPERNPDLPVFKCAPDVAHAREAVVLRFSTATGIRELWVHYDGCTTVGFTNGTRTWGLYPAPLKLILQGSVRPTNGTYLDHLSGW